MFRRFWTLILALAITTGLAAQILTRVDQVAISIFTGVLVALFVLSQAFSLRISVTEKTEARMKPVIGILSGFLGGISGIHGPPLLSFLVALKMPKEEFMCAVSLIYLTGTFPLFGTLIANGGHFHGGRLGVVGRLRALVDWRSTWRLDAQPRVANGVSARRAVHVVHRRAEFNPPRIYIGDLDARVLYKAC